MNVPQVHCARRARDSPLVVAYGMGMDSTAMLVGLHRHGIRPDLILFADTGGEKPDTYLYAPIIRQWLRDVDFPQFEVVRYVPPIAPYDSLYGECHKNHTLPGIAFRKKSCSIKWKREPQDRRVRSWEPAQECWDAGGRVRKLIGFDASEERRRYADNGDDPQYRHWYPLMDWGLDREACKRLIADARLPVPVKSACFFCPAMKKPEIADLAVQDPDLLGAALEIEQRYVTGKHFRPNRAGAVQGLGIRYRWSDLPVRV
jgi:hypothetical protein